MVVNKGAAGGSSGVDERRRDGENLSSVSVEGMAFSGVFRLTVKRWFCVPGWVMKETRAEWGLSAVTRHLSFSSCGLRSVFLLSLILNAWCFEFGQAYSPFQAKSDGRPR